MSDKRIISCAITGSIHTPTMSEYLPITPERIADDALLAAAAGAASVHIHVRNPENGMPSPDLALYEKVISRIRAKNKDVIICLTTGGGAGMTFEQRVAPVVRFKPALASMNAGSINWGLFPLAAKIKDWKYEWEPKILEMTKGFIFENTFANMMNAVKKFNELGTVPELECYDVGHIYNVKFLKDVGLLKGKPFLQFVMGINGAIQATPYDLIHMKETADRCFGVGGYNWSAFGAGRWEYPICLMNLFLGGHVRVGMEDNLNLSKGVPAKNNGELVEKMARLMKELDYEIATPAEAREMLGITNVTNV